MNFFCLVLRWLEWTGRDQKGERWKAYIFIGALLLIGAGCNESSQNNADGNDSATETQSTDSASETDSVDSATESATDSSTDTGTDTTPPSCDGEDVDCYTECWQCAYENECQDAVNACLADEGCNAFLTCKETECCDEDNPFDCLSGTEWETCMNECRETNQVLDTSVELYLAIDLCIACDICAVSCYESTNDFGICASPDPPPGCYGNGDTDTTACFTWAGWGDGPCTEQTSACKENETCVELETCINESWSADNWQVFQQECFSVAGVEAETIYWAYMQCIYCDACEIACAADAGSKRCDEYDGDGGQ